MKKYCAWSLYICGAFAAVAAVGVEGELQVVERGPHHRKVVHVSSILSSDGQTIWRTNHYTELATGMHYQRNGEWLESKEVIDIVPGGGLASQGAHQVGFAANINTAGAINFLTSDNKRLRSHVLGLAYTDATTGQSVLIAEVKDSIGELMGDNQIFYRDAFNAPDFTADIQYIYTRAGLEQNIVFRPGGSLPPPALYNFNPDTTRLEVFTEFIEAPAPGISQSTLARVGDAQQRAAMVLPDFNDQSLDFGAMHIGSGEAFPIGDQAQERSAVSTGKTWEQREGRTFLVEAVQYSAVKPHLDALAANAVARPRPERQIGKTRTFPKGPQQARNTQDKMRMAALRPDSRSFVIDYSIVAADTNFTFKGDSTYFVINATVNLSGTTVFEGGAVVKFTNGTSSRVVLKGPVDFRTSPYLPVMFTAKDDNSVGETIAGSTGSISGRYGQWAVRAESTTNSFVISNIVVRHVSEGVSGSTGTSVSIWNSQFINCTIAHRSGGNNTMRNCLVAQSRYAFVCGVLVTNTIEHLTMTAGDAVASTVGGGSLFLTNCLLVAMTNWGGFTGGTNVYSNTVFSAVFQSVGAGDHYLKDNTYRDIGTTGINPDLLAIIQQRTTYPPLWLSNAVLTDVVLAPATLRDSGSPDLGYHYAPLDYYCSGLVLSNVTVALTNGASLAADYALTNWGLSLKNSKLLSAGSPTNLNRIIRAHNVQERSSAMPATRAFFYDGDSTMQTNELRMRFTSFSQLASDGNQLSTGTNFSALEWSHSVMQNAVVILKTDGTNTITCGLTNTVWERGSNQFGLTASSAGSTVHARNNLFKNSQQHFLGGNSGWTICDNLIDGGGLYDHGTALTNRNNAYYQATTNLSGGTSNLTLGSLTYVIGPLSIYYQPTNSTLINTGSVAATSVALYHFTSTTNQVKETNSVVDIGPHWVALDANSKLVDSDTDGIPDYYEDWSGNGSVDSGETDWQNAGDHGLRVFITRPRNSIIP